MVALALLTAVATTVNALVTVGIAPAAARGAGIDWLQPNPRCPLRSDSAAWIADVLDAPHTRGRLDALLEAP